MGTLRRRLNLSPSAVRLATMDDYERFAWAAVVVTAASAVADRAILVKYYNQSPIFYPIVIACIFAAQLLWIWLIARKRQNWARWISLVAIVFGIPSEIYGFDERFRFNAAMAIASCAAFVIWMVAVSLLFRRDSREWFADKRFASDAGQPS